MVQSRYSAAEGQVTQNVWAMSNSDEGLNGVWEAGKTLWESLSTLGDAHYKGTFNKSIAWQQPLRPRLSYPGGGRAWFFQMGCCYNVGLSSRVRNKRSSQIMWKTVYTYFSLCVAMHALPSVTHSSSLGIMLAHYQGYNNGPGAFPRITNQSSWLLLLADNSSDLSCSASGISALVQRLKSFRSDSLLQSGTFIKIMALPSHKLLQMSDHWVF